MKKFAFRLQTVLDRARDEEETLLQQLALVVKEQTEQEMAIARATDARRDLLAQLAALQQGEVDPWDLHRGALRLEAQANDLAQLREALRAIAARVAAAQQAVVEAMRKRQLLEKLRDKKLAAYRQEVERQELQAMEEAVLPRLARERAVEQARWEAQNSGVTS